MAKPRANIYTVLLALALVAVLIGCLFLILEHRRYTSGGLIFGGTGEARSALAVVGGPLVPGSSRIAGLLPEQA